MRMIVVVMGRGVESDWYKLSPISLLLPPLPPLVYRFPIFLRKSSRWKMFCSTHHVNCCRCDVMFPDFDVLKTHIAFLKYAPLRWNEYTVLAVMYK